jgi:hypothetical protein
MELALIGLQKSGKTTVFNALTGGHAQTSAFAGGKLEPNVAMVNVPDPRVEKLSEIYTPKKTTHATVKYIDVAGLSREGSAEHKGVPEALLQFVSKADALIAVLRGYEDPVHGAPAPGSDVEGVHLEMIFSDLAKVFAQDSFQGPGPYVLTLIILSILLSFAIFLVLLRYLPLLAGYHAAEHQTISAIEAGEALTLDAVARMLDAGNAAALLTGMDVVVDALDTIGDRLLLGLTARQLAIPLVHAAIAGFTGQVATVLPGDPGLEQIYHQGAGPSRGIETVLGNPAATPAVAAALQAQEVVKLLTGVGEPLSRKLLYFDTEYNIFETLTLGPG